MSGRRGCRPLVAVVGVAFALASCSTSHLSLVSDHRLSFVAPPRRAHVRVPVELQWSMRGHFAVFVDRAPIQPGQTLKAVAARDASCHHTPGCPDASYFTNRQIYTTDADHLVLDRVADLAHDREKEQLHEVTVVLLDSTGHRIGESAWYLDFWLPRAGRA